MRNELKGIPGIVMVFLILGFGICLPFANAETSTWQPHSQASLQWDRQVTGASAAASTDAGAQADPALLLVDIWLDSTANFGGMYTPLASNKQSIYKTKVPRYAWPEGGFHYIQENGTPSWYISTLRALSDIAQKHTETLGRVRVLRYGDEILPTSFLTNPDHQLLPAGASEAQQSAVRRDMMTYDFDPKPGVWTAMVDTSQADVANSFYIPENPANYRLRSFASQFLEMPELHERMIDAQKTWRNLLADPLTKTPYTLASTATAGQQAYPFPLAYAMDNMNWDHLNIITLDTLSYQNPVGRRQMSGGNQAPINYIEELLLKHEVFTAKGLSMGIVACRSDYVGFVTRVNGVLLDEALLWGRVNQERRNGQDMYTPYKASAPRTFLMLLIGPPDAVNMYMEELAEVFDGSQFKGQAPRGLRMKGKSFLGTLPFYFDSEIRSVSTFPFDYRMHTIRGANFSSYTQANPDVTVACATGTIQPGDEASVPLVTLTYDPLDPAAGNDQITISVHVDAEKDKKFTEDPGAYEDAYKLRLVRQLVLEGEAPNDPGTIQSLKDSGTPFVLKRNEAYIYGPGETVPAIFEEKPMTITSDAGGALFTLPVEVNRKTLRPGYYRINLTVRVESNTVNQPLPAWIQPGGMPVPPLKAGDSWDWERNGQSWSFSPDHVQTGNWQALATAARAIGNKADRLGDLEHALYSKKMPSNIDSNIPPVFQVFHLNDLAVQFQRAADTETHTLIDYTFDVQVVFAGEAEP